MKRWSDEFGKDYTDRNYMSVSDYEELCKKRFGISRSEMNTEFLSSLDKKLRVLEVGCNIGNQLRLLQRQGFNDLWGIEISEYALELARKETRGMNLVHGSALDLPFKDGYFDLVFTSGVLIHINPEDAKKAVDEIYRVSKKYIWGFEYFSEQLQELDYRGNKGLLWKNNFAKLYMDRHPDLTLVNEKRMKYSDSDNVDSMFLLEKKG
ncbi:TPA: methyltransferase domain-containing protein [Candidatus Micrarchaeota archaeon]|nr:methyltransferase domain-containing protein [Candidatus Micrarchaeota archaeon]